MEQYYSAERNAQILIALLKAHGIKRAVISPGSTNVTVAGCLQYDSWFELYSCVDERSAAYMACGIAAETREPVILSCTGATASRNYFPALTEAYYRQLPIIAVTSTQDVSKVGNMICQVIDRSLQPKDTVRCSVHIQNIKDSMDEKDVELKINKAILELNHHGVGPVHINLSTTYSPDFKVKTLPSVRKISRIMPDGKFPELPAGKIAIYIGTHWEWNEDEVTLIDDFCQAYNAVVFADTSSNYYGKYRVDYELANAQPNKRFNHNPNLLIHIGDMSDQTSQVGFPKQCWRVAEDGKLSDRYGCLTNVFEMTIKVFFRHYVDIAGNRKGDDSYLNSCNEIVRCLLNKIPELPFSHIWVAKQMASEFPSSSCVHLGILSPLRSWSYFRFPESVRVYCNQGGFGIDGNISTLIGASQIHKDKLYFCIVGDLSFFYDLNILCNRHVGNNIRILLINNSLGAEFHLFKQANSVFLQDISGYVSAGGHNGEQSSNLVKHFATDLGFEYMSAWTKEEFLANYRHFVTPKQAEKPMVFEVFTQVEDENEALRLMWCIDGSRAPSVAAKIKREIKETLGAKKTEALKTLLKG